MFASLLCRAWRAVLCNTQLCVPPLKPCPGSSTALGDDGLPVIECSGHGTCNRDAAAPCRTGDTCVVSCVCASGYASSSCAITSDALQSAQALVTSFVAVLVSTHVGHTAANVDT